MKSKTQLRQVAPTVRTGRGHTASGLARYTLPVATALALVASAVLTGATFATAMEVVPTTIPTLMIGWAAAIGLTFALPLVVVTGVVAVLERLQ